MINNIYSLPELDFIGGSSHSFLFHTYCDEAKTKPLDLENCTANFSIVSFANKNGDPAVSKEMAPQKNGVLFNTLQVTLAPTDTLNLFGKYVYQITIVDGSGNVDLKQGIAYIHHNINTSILQQ